jgi:2,5-diketo-D-gluconate reductase A
MTQHDHPSIPSDTARLPGGGSMPLVGFGTWQLTGEQAVDATRDALEVGYRHLDTATIYDNEREVGRAVTESGVPREQIFLTTKCGPPKAGRELETLERSLEMLGTDHVDLWLVHWVHEDRLGLGLWERFVEAQRKGLATDIGVSNYDTAQVDRLEAETGVRPAVNQVKWSPLLFDRSVVEAHRERGIVLEGYSGLKGGTLEAPTIRSVADRLGRTPAQVILRWHLQHGIVSIPKSANPGRIRSNADLGGFELSEEDMAALDALAPA